MIPLAKHSEGFIHSKYMGGNQLFKDCSFTVRMIILYTIKIMRKIKDVLLKSSMAESMFTTWFEANMNYHEARGSTYSKFVSKFVYVKKKKKWKPRKKRIHNW